MPSLPTSLILVGLVVAWLVVLVPMVARRREQVPENHEDGAGFRVLERRGMRGHRRPVLSRTAMVREEDVPGVRGDGLDDDSDDGSDGVTRIVVDDAADDAADGTLADDASQDVADDVADDAEVDGIRDGVKDVGVGRVRDAADDWEQEHAVHSGNAKPLWRGESRVDDRASAMERERTERAPYRAPAEEREVAEDVEYWPVPVRPGRGGFDPRAAERARAYRFRQRRRVALVLVALMLAGVPVGLLGIGYGWVATVAAGVLLVLYLAYLRRQVRIEEAIRQRRAARLERARQIRPGYRPSVAEQVYAHRTGEMPRVGADIESEYLVRSHVRPTVPPSSYGRGVPVDLEDSDPAFDDLEYYRPAIARRRAG